MADPIPTARIFPSAWNRWQLALNKERSSADVAQQIAEWFQDRVFPNAKIPESFLQFVAVVPVSGETVAYMPAGVPPIYGQAELVGVTFWAPANAAQIPWPFDPPGAFTSDDRIVLYRIFAADKSRKSPAELAKDAEGELPAEKPSTAERALKAGMWIGAGLLVWRFLGLFSGRGSSSGSDNNA